MELASRCGYTVAVEVAPNKIAQNIEFTKSLPKSAIEKILPGEALAGALKLRLELFIRHHNFTAVL